MTTAGRQSGATRFSVRIGVTNRLIDLSPAPVVFPGAHWEHVDPAKAGWSVAKLKAAEDCARTIDSAAVLVVQDGNVIATFGDGDKKLHIHSVSKSFMSALYGIAVANHRD